MEFLFWLRGRSRDNTTVDWSLHSIQRWVRAGVLRSRLSREFALDCRLRWAWERCIHGQLQWWLWRSSFRAECSWRPLRGGRNRVCRNPLRHQRPLHARHQLHRLDQQHPGQQLIERILIWFVVYQYFAIQAYQFERNADRILRLYYIMPRLAFADVLYCSKVKVK